MNTALLSFDRATVLGFATLRNIAPCVAPARSVEGIVFNQHATADNQNFFRVVQVRDEASKREF